ncbi:hypothetical protein K491DRAFT_324347 [Lophiostoma macrostomum CBS 122681]|uniref:Secreted protein n=1 Tax=Lophiostoma macrostomum CBS 122681 TaxID=1314788 RepID=A0A6A6TDZ5_9PLEO|nr:hypothetical protein K491DRAFT_324347 [Lophiostoma macrostomum CBS 122681]
MEALWKVVHATLGLVWLMVARTGGGDGLNSGRSSQAVPKPDSMQRGGGEQQFSGTSSSGGWWVAPARCPANRTSLAGAGGPGAGVTQRFQGARCSSRSRM